MAELTQRNAAQETVSLEDAPFKQYNLTANDVEELIKNRNKQETVKKSHLRGIQSRKCLLYLCIGCCCFFFVMIIVTAIANAASSNGKASSTQNVMNDLILQNRKTRHGKSSSSGSSSSFSMPSTARQIDEDHWHLGTRQIEGKIYDGYLHMIRHVNERDARYERAQARESANKKPNKKNKSSSGRRYEGGPNDRKLKRKYLPEDLNHEKPIVDYLEGDCWSTLVETVYMLQPNMSFGIDFTNINGLSSNTILAAVNKAHNMWDCRTGYALFGAYDPDIVVDGPNFDSPDLQNEIMFGPIGMGNGVIAVTVTWFDTDDGFIKEWDIVLDDEAYVFCDAAIDDTCVDLLGILTHEVGHSLGLADQYISDCSEVTMYAFANHGEIKKRTLDTPDVTGLLTIYGEDSNGSCVNSAVRSFICNDFVLLLSLFAIFVWTLTSFPI
jgi:hypothetical protein